MTSLVLRNLTLLSIVSLGAASLAAPSPVLESAKVLHRLPGKSIKAEEAVRKSELIVTAVLEDLGISFPTAAGVASWPMAKFRVTKILKGSCGDKLVVSVRVLEKPDETQEEAPKVGTEYLLLLTGEANNLQAFKMLPADQENIAALTTILNAQSKKQ